VADVSPHSCVLVWDRVFDLVGPGRAQLPRLSLDGDLWRGAS
jgi:hypothetical protein